MLLPYLHKNLIEAGCDEAGRGCLAGPVFAAAVILPKKIEKTILDDSKKLTEVQRDEMAIWVRANAIAYAIKSVSCDEIDEINILNASFKAMQLAVLDLTTRPDHLLIDGNRFNQLDGYDHSCIIKGDSKYASIAAASILAKTARDDYMKSLANDYPQYGWECNKGYPTKVHRANIKAHGHCCHHRLSFKLLAD